MNNYETTSASIQIIANEWNSAVSSLNSTRYQGNGQGPSRSGKQSSV